MHNSVRRFDFMRFYDRIVSNVSLKIFFLFFKSSMFFDFLFFSFIRKIHKKKEAYKINLNCVLSHTNKIKCLSSHKLIKILYSH